MRYVLMFILVSLASTALADEYVSGYYRNNGTYVEPHYRSSSNNTTLDNYSTRGNTNPYTGEKGYRDPYPTYNSNQGNQQNSYGNLRRNLNE
jgi:hypothetical protein